MAKEASLEANRLVSPTKSLQSGVSNNQSAANASSLENMEFMQNNNLLNIDESSSLSLLNNLRDLIHQADATQSPNNILKDIGNIMKNIEKINKNSQNTTEDNSHNFPLKNNIQENNNKDNFNIVSNIDRLNKNKNNEIDLILKYESETNIDFSKEDVKEITDSTIPYVATFYPNIKTTLIEATSQNTARIENKADIKLDNLEKTLNISELISESDSDSTETSSEEIEAEEESRASSSNTNQNKIINNSSNSTIDAIIDSKPDIINNETVQLIDTNNNNDEPTQSITKNIILIEQNDSTSKTTETNQGNHSIEPVSNIGIEPVSNIGIEQSANANEVSTEDINGDGQKKPLQLYDIMEDTQRLIHQMRDEIKSDIASFNSENTSDESDSDEYNSSESSAVPASSINEPRSQNDDYFSDSENEMLDEEIEEEEFGEADLEEEELEEEEEEVEDEADESDVESFDESNMELTSEIQDENRKNTLDTLSKQNLAEKSQSIMENNSLPNDDEIILVLHNSINNDGSILNTEEQIVSNENNIVELNNDEPIKNTEEYTANNDNVESSILNKIEPQPQPDTNESLNQSHENKTEITNSSNINLIKINNNADEINDSSNIISLTADEKNVDTVVIVLNKKSKLKAKEIKVEQSSSNTVATQNSNDIIVVIENKATNDNNQVEQNTVKEINTNISQNVATVSTQPALEIDIKKISNKQSKDSQLQHVERPLELDTVQEEKKVESNITKVDQTINEEKSLNTNVNILPKSSVSPKVEPNEETHNIKENTLENTPTNRIKTDDNTSNSSVIPVKKVNKAFVSQIPKLEKQPSNKTIVPPKTTPKINLKKTEIETTKPVIPFSNFQSGNVKKLQQGLFSKVNITIAKPTDKPSPKIPIPINSKRSSDINPPKISNISKNTPENTLPSSLQSDKPKGSKMKKEGILKPYFVETCLSDDYFTETDEEGKQIPKTIKKTTQIIKKNVSVKKSEPEKPPPQKKLNEINVDYSMISFKEGSPEVSSHMNLKLDMQLQVNFTLK